VKQRQEFFLPSLLETIDEAVVAALKIAAENGVDENGLFAIDLAVREAVANAVKHGNKFAETKQVKITFETTSEKLTIEIEDQGEGFEPNSVPDPTKPENLLKTSGRGILFMQNFMDSVAWTRSASGGTIVRLVKKF
jgi:serine/threonine-protein kinase RsbW